MPAVYDSHTSHRFTGLIRDARPLAEAFTRRLCRSSEETKDLIQDATVVAWNYFPQLHDQTQFGVLLIQIVKQQFFYKKRSEERRKPYIGELPGIEPVNPDESGWELLESNLDLRGALVALKEEEKEIILLQWAGFTLKELTIIYGCKISCMNMRLRRAKENIKEYLANNSKQKNRAVPSKEDITAETMRLVEWANRKLMSAEVIPD
jgi:RNA polymerase sigma factor (sigma-70 family)